VDKVANSARIVESRDLVTIAGEVDRVVRLTCVDKASFRNFVSDVILQLHSTRRLSVTSSRSWKAVLHP
jgi:hypothetical protein